MTDDMVINGEIIERRQSRQQNGNSRGLPA